MWGRFLLIVAVSVGAGLPGHAGPLAECRQLCGTERKGCAPALATCLAGARSAARDARSACTTASCRREARAIGRDAASECRAGRRRCRTQAVEDCRRALDEPVVPENALTSCPVTPLTACAELGADQPCDDRLDPADVFFWDRFHAGDYDAIPQILDRLQAALVERPDDPSLQRHVAWANIWRLGELSRGTVTGPDLASSIAQTRPDFARAWALNPDDPRVLGFLAGITLAEGILFKDATLYDEGSALFAQGIAAWPEFNYFSSGYILSQLPRDSAGFQLGLEQQWRNVDVCAGIVVDRQQPDLVATFARETHVGRLRVCWNSWIAPFNLEGFLLNLGDMLVKNGQVATGVQVYQAAQQADGYERWPFRGVLEQRIVDAAENATRFNQPSAGAGHTIMFQSSYSCMGCHQTR
jgi:hypothetical protein